LAKHYPGRRGEPIYAVQDINLVIEDKEFMVLVGPSGCGKSTTLRLIAGLEEPDSGAIIIDDQVVNTVPPKDRDIAMVFQNYALYPHMTVYENMAFALKLRKFPKNQIRQRVQDAAAILGLQHCLDRLPKALSGGERQRVAVGRAIVRAPQVFLFDEPLSNLDAQMRIQMRLELTRLRDRLATTMIYVTHDQVEAMTMGDRIAVMHAGRIQQVADPLALYHRPDNLFVAGFIGSPPMNFFRGTLVQATDSLCFVEEQPANLPASTPLTFKIPLEQANVLGACAGQKLVLGLRPEDVTCLSQYSPTLSVVVEATLELVERLGPETFLHLTTGRHRFAARLTTGACWPLFQKVPVTFNLAKAHWFDDVTGRALANPASPAKPGT
jgi:multiple sugar transport system ATP-binding protein